MPDLTNILDQVDEVMKKEKIVKLNDWLRKEGRGGKVVCTPGVYASKDYESILNAVINFDNFNESNDPHGEHDFGKVTINETDYFFKIDYYDKRHSCMSEDPSDQTKTNRVMTIMKASEYWWEYLINQQANGKLLNYIIDESGFVL